MRTETALADAVAHAVATSVTSLEAVVREPIAYDAFLAGRSLTRVRGRAVTPAGKQPWSLVEKLTEGRATASPYLYDNGMRELLAYRSGLLDDLAAGVRAPAAHGLREEADGRLTLWLEDVSGDGRRPRSADDLLRIARHLGRLGGWWLERVPEEPWLFTGWIDRHGQPEAVAPALELLRTLGDPARIERRLRRGVDEVTALIRAQGDYRATLESLPVTLCHHDAVAANVFMRHRDGAVETVLIDWESVGPGPIGADLASLLFSSPRRGDVPTATALAVVEPGLAAYRAGFADAGVDLDASTLRLAFDAAIALRWKLACDVIAAIDREETIFRGSATDESPDEALDELIHLTELLFASADAVRPARA